MIYSVTTVLPLYNQISFLQKFAFVMIINSGVTDKDNFSKKFIQENNCRQIHELLFQF